MHDIIGRTVRDQITGFQGVVTGRVEYLTGCNQLLVAPPTDKTGALRDSQWFDEQRCAVTNAKKIAIDNGTSPGADKTPPVR